MGSLTLRYDRYYRFLDHNFNSVCDSQLIKLIISQKIQSPRHPLTRLCVTTDSLHSTNTPTALPRVKNRDSQQSKPESVMSQSQMLLLPSLKNVYNIKECI